MLAVPREGVRDVAVQHVEIGHPHIMSHTVPAVNLPTEVLDRRARAWCALADLFLDTEVRPGLPHMALTLVETGYEDVELEAIFFDEVAPVLHWNLKQVAGEWAGFDEDWLREQITARRRPEVLPRVSGRIRSWAQRLLARPASEDFEVVMALVPRVRAMDEPTRVVWAMAMRALAELYFEQPENRAFLAGSQERLVALSDRITPEALRGLVERDLYPLFARLRVRKVDAPEPIGRAQVEAALERSR